MPIGRARRRAPMAPDDWRERRTENRSILGWIFGFWIVAIVAYALWLKISYDLRGDLNCPIPGGTDSAYGHGTWQWLPPGNVCSYPGTNIPTKYPSVARAVIGAFLLLVPITLIPLWISSELSIRRRLPESSLARDSAA